MSVAVTTIEKLVDSACAFGEKVIYLIEAKALRLVRLNNETFAGVRTATQFDSNVKAAAESDEIEDAPTPADGQVSWWNIGGRTKYLVTGPESCFVLLASDRHLMAAAVTKAGAPGAVEKFKKAGGIVVPTVMFSFVSP